MSKIKDVHIINLPKIEDSRGNLSFIEENNHIPFKIKRVYWIYDVPGGEERGGHAYIKNCEFIVALSGSFDVVLNDGTEEHIFHLNRSYYGLYVPNGIWRSLRNFSTNALGYIMASEHYTEDDYIRNFETFKIFDISGAQNLPVNTDERKVRVLQYDFTRTTIYDCFVAPLPKNHNRAGNITALDSPITIPFDIKRTYYLYDIPGGETRGGHAHKELYQLIVAAGGSFDVLLDDGKCKKIVSLNQPYYGLYIVPGIWRELLNFSSGSNCLVVASQCYSEDDYIREYDNFKSLKNN